MAQGCTGTGHSQSTSTSIHSLGPKVAWPVITPPKEVISARAGTSIRSPQLGLHEAASCSLQSDPTPLSPSLPAAQASQGLNTCFESNSLGLHSQQHFNPTFSNKNTA